MASPVAILATQGTASVAGGNATFNLPSTVNAGETWLLIATQTVTTRNPTWPASWNDIFDNNSGGTTNVHARLFVVWHKVTGTEGATLPVPWSGASSVGYFIYRLTGADDPATNPPEVAAVARGNTVSPDPGTVTPTGGAKDYLFFATIAYDQATDPTGTPAGYSNLVTQLVGSDNVVAVAEKAANAASEDPAAFTIAVADFWVATTIAIHPAPGGATLTVQDATHGHTADNVDLVQANVLVANDATHGHVAENVVLSLGGTNLTVQDATHAHSADSPSLIQANVLVVQDAAHAHTADSPSLTQQHILAVADALHALSSDVPALTQQHVLAVADALHGHFADNVDLASGAQLVVSDAYHVHSAEAPALTQAHILVVNDAHHAHSAESPTISVTWILTVADALHAHSAENVSLVFGIALSPQDARHLHFVDSPSLIQAFLLAVQDAFHAHSAENVDLSAAYTLAVQDAWHAHFADNVILIALGAQPVITGELNLVPRLSAVVMIDVVTRLSADIQIESI
jgi:hypothetical protein